MDRDLLEETTAVKTEMLRHRKKALCIEPTLLDVHRANGSLHILLPLFAFWLVTLQLVVMPCDVLDVSIIFSVNDDQFEKI